MFCVPGKYLLDGACVDCPIGSYKTSHGNEPCTACTVNTTAGVGATSPSECSVGKKLYI